MKKCAISLLLLLLLPVAFAEEFSLRVKPIKERVSYGETAVFYVTVTNNLDMADDYRITFNDVGLWDLYYTDPRSDYQSGINNIQPGESYATRVYFVPRTTTPVGYHTTRIIFTSKSTGETTSADFIIYVSSSPKPREYLPNIACSVRFPDKIDPRQPAFFAVVLTNKNTKNITFLEIDFSSILLKNVTPYITPLGPGEKKELKFPLFFDSQQAPQKDSLKTKILIEDHPHPFECNKQEFEIIDYTGDFSLKSEPVETFLKTVEQRTYKNNGNAKKTQRVLEPTSQFTNIFSWSEPEPDETLSISGERYRAWEFTLRPGEAAKIIIYTNYRPLFHFLLAALVIMGFYYYFRAPITIKKQTRNVEMREGGVSEVKIILMVKNRTKYPLDHLIIHDMIPHLTQVHPEFGAGMMKPDKILRHASGGTLLEWHIDELEPYEERLISYKIKSNLRIIGSFDLSPAYIKYSTKAGRKVRVNSNRLVVGE